MLWRGPSSLLRRIISKQHQSQAPLVLQRVDVEVHLEFKCLTLLLSRTSIFLQFRFTFHKKCTLSQLWNLQQAIEGMPSLIFSVAGWSRLSFDNYFCLKERATSYRRAEHRQKMGHRGDPRHPLGPHLV